MHDEERNRGRQQKQPESNEQNGNMCIPINNYLKCKWIKFVIQKAEWLNRSKTQDTFIYCLQETQVRRKDTD